MTITVPLVGLLLASTLAASRPARSQCLPLQTLTKDLAAGHLTPPTLAASLPTSEWELHQPPTGSVYWAFIAPAEPSEPAGPDTRLELRRSNQQAQYDVVYKTPRKACIGDLRAELRRAKLKAEPVTCLQCEAERFIGPTYTVTLYNQQQNFSQGKAPYPFVVVVHSLAAGPAPAN